MTDFEISLNSLLVDTFTSILKYEEMSLRKSFDTPLTIAEAHMIETIGKQESRVSISQIAMLSSIAVPTATVAVKKLEQKGLVEKIPCQTDGRRALVGLTAKGKKVDRAHRIFHEKMTRNISRQFLDSEKEVLLVAIDKLNEFFKHRIGA